MNRIVSLIASSTEIVHALGFGNQMVGKSHECDYPETIKDLPVCTEPKFRTDGTSYEIDQRVKAIVQEGLSVYRVKADMLEALQPTHIITQAQCEVCAVSLKDVEAAACELIASHPKIVSLEPNCLEDIYEDISRVGTALGATERSDKLNSELRSRISEIAIRAKQLQQRPSVACIEWIEPLMAAGNWMPELVELAGGINLFGEAGKHSPWMTWEQLVERDPDIIIVCPCGFDIERALREMNLIVDHPEFQKLQVARNGNLFVCDGNQYFNRPGPRVVESLEILAEIFHPNHFKFGHERTGWIDMPNHDQGRGTQSS
jgi:iron complex transport system substrate-binding protein